MKLRVARKVERRDHLLHYRPGTKAAAAARLFAWDGRSWGVRVRPKGAADALTARRMSMLLTWELEKLMPGAWLEALEEDMRQRMVWLGSGRLSAGDFTTE